jgi:hypothetical protein
MGKYIVKMEADGSTFYLMGFNRVTGDYMITFDKEEAYKYYDTMVSNTAMGNLKKLVDNSDKWTFSVVEL